MSPDVHLRLRSAPVGTVYDSGIGVGEAGLLWVAAGFGTLQRFGLGLAVAVLVDALVIRCLVVPAVMRLFGVRTWWLPRWLGKAQPSVALEPPESHSKTLEFTRSNEMR